MKRKRYFVSFLVIISIVFFSANTMTITKAEETSNPITSTEATQTDTASPTSSPTESASPSSSPNESAPPSTSPSESASPTSSPTETAEATPSAQITSEPTQTAVPLSNDAGLISVSINGTSVSVSGGTGTYSTPARDMSMVIVTSSTEASVTAGGITQYHSGNNTFSFSKFSGESFIWNVQIKAEDGVTTNSFSISVVRTAPTQKPTVKITHIEGSNSYSIGPVSNEYHNSEFSYYRVKGSSTWISLPTMNYLTVGQNMNENTVYQVCARVSNEIGYSPYSDIVEIGPYQVIKLGEIANLTYTQDGNSFTFTWDCINGYDGGKYQVSVETNDFGSTTSISKKSYTYTILPGETVVFTVRQSYAELFGQEKKITATNNNEMDNSVPPEAIPRIGSTVSSDFNSMVLSVRNSQGTYKTKFQYKIDNGALYSVPEQYYNSDHTSATIPISALINGKVTAKFSFNGCFYNDAGDGPYSSLTYQTIVRNCMYNISMTEASSTVTLKWDSPADVDHFIIERVIFIHSGSYRTDMAVAVSGNSYTMAKPTAQEALNVSYYIKLDTTYYPNTWQRRLFGTIYLKGGSVNNEITDGPEVTPEPTQTNQEGGAVITFSPTPKPDYSTNLASPIEVNGVNITMANESDEVSIEISQDTLEELGSIENAKSIIVKYESVKTDTEKYYTMIDANAKLITDLLNFEVVVTDEEGVESFVTQFPEPIKITVELNEEQIMQIDEIDDLIMYHVNPLTGAVEKFEVEFDSEAKEVTFYTNHFSVYVLVEQKSHLLEAIVLSILIVLAVSVLVIAVYIKQKSLFLNKNTSK